MSIFDKMKSGLNQVKDKAQQTVEYTKLYTQIASKRKDIQEHYEQLGELVYRASGMSTVTSTSMDDAEGRMKGLCREISELEIQIVALEQELARVKGEKLCSCGEAAPYEAKFCSHCGNSFKEEIYVAEVPIAVTPSSEERTDHVHSKSVDSEPVDADAPEQPAPDRDQERQE
ncbi:zinc ribbon domain-containing protein [Paenibacillus sp. GCM10027629]|uniref:zinc ribbon domain-containing protein n=1 Tax=Paenibacillus sp. GCM10027629 TaxID=3273414 RepID=UPI003627420F